MMPMCLDMPRKGFGDQLARIVWKAVLESYIDLRVEGKAYGLIRLVEALEVGIPGYKGPFWPDEESRWRQYLNALRVGRSM
jgi:hypothetical protein